MLRQTVNLSKIIKRFITVFLSKEKFVLRRSSWFVENAQYIVHPNFFAHILYLLYISTLFKTSLVTLLVHKSL